MILECPECHTRYLVPDTAIGGEGRTVRCANCRHSWFQEGPQLAPEVPLTAVQAEPPQAPPAAPAIAPPPPIAAAPSVTAAAPGYDAFAHQPPFRPRRNPARRWTALAIAAALLMLIAVGAILYSGQPGLASQLGIPIGSRDTPLRFDDRAQTITRSHLQSGAELFAIGGKVVNPTGTTQHVPDIRAELRDAQGRLVYSWIIAPQQRRIPAEGSMAFNSAKLDVPANSKMLELSFAGDALP